MAKLVFLAIAVTFLCFFWRDDLQPTPVFVFGVAFLCHRCDIFLFFFWRDDLQPAPGVTNLLSATLWAGETLLQTR